jgi:hypothetical protein
VRAPLTGARVRASWPCAPPHAAPPSRARPLLVRAPRAHLVSVCAPGRARPPHAAPPSRARPLPVRAPRARPVSVRAPGRARPLPTRPRLPARDPCPCAPPFPWAPPLPRAPRGPCVPLFTVCAPRARLSHPSAPLPCAPPEYKSHKLVVHSTTWASGPLTTERWLTAGCLGGDHSFYIHSHSHALGCAYMHVTFHVFLFIFIVNACQLGGHIKLLVSLYTF